MSAPSSRSCFILAISPYSAAFSKPEMDTTNLLQEKFGKWIDCRVGRVVWGVPFVRSRHEENQQNCRRQRREEWESDWNRTIVDSRCKDVLPEGHCNLIVFPNSMEQKFITVS
jgi:hypothetical protein